MTTSLKGTSPLPLSSDGPKFKIDVHRYDGTTNPRDFLQLYSLDAAVIGADEMMMTSWFPLALK